MSPLTTFWLAFERFLEELVYGDKHTRIIDHTAPSTPPLDAPKPPPVASKYQWDTKDHIRHTVRVICDEEGLTLEQKNTMCATIAAESGFKLTAKFENKLNGKIWSTDWGICQWNDYFHAKEISPKEAVENPEKAVRLMCQYWKRGQRVQWSAYRNRSYRAYL